MFILIDASLHRRASQENVGVGCMLRPPEFSNCYFLSRFWEKQGIFSSKTRSALLDGAGLYANATIPILAIPLTKYHLRQKLVCLVATLLNCWDRHEALKYFTKRKNHVCGKSLYGQIILYNWCLPVQHFYLDLETFQFRKAAFSGGKTVDCWSINLTFTWLEVERQISVLHHILPFMPFISPTWMTLLAWLM